jgi:hypothetical protein
MIKTYRSLIAIAVASTAIFFQCTPSVNEVENPANHFDVRQLLEDQIQLLDSLNPTLKKELRFQNDTTYTNSNNIDWESELSMFFELDINKPALAPLYDSTTGEVLMYHLKEPTNKADVKELKIKKDEGGRLLRIGGTVLRNNYLYRTERKLLLEFNPESERLKSFQIISATKVILKGDEKGEVKGKIQYTDGQTQ